MKAEDITKLFPVTVQVTQEIIDMSQNNLDNIQGCIGYNALASALPKELRHNILWAYIGGLITIDSSQSIALSSNGIDLTKIEKPTKVKFSICNEMPVRNNENTRTIFR